MIKNYFLIAVRRLTGNATFTFLNIFGLTLGIGAFLLMYLYIQSELSYDKFNVDADRIVRVTTYKQTPEAAFRSAQTALPVGPALQADFKEVRHAARIMKTDALLKYKDVVNRENNLVFADPGIFEIFSFEVISGDLGKALDRPNTIVLTQQTATRYFANEDPLGKELILDDTNKFYVTGVIKSLPSSSHISFDGILSMHTAEVKDSGYDWLFTNWYSEAGYTYLLLEQQADIESLQSKLPEFSARHRRSGDESTYTYSLEKLTDIYLHSRFDDQSGKTGSLPNIYAFSLVALFIIIIAAINYINLTTAQSSDRAREVGIRKVSGATPWQLRGQYISETVLITLASAFLAVGIAQLILPVFNSFAGKELSFSVADSAGLLYALGFILVTSILAGYYPAFVISRFKPVLALKGKLRSSPLGIRVRETLVVIQFAVSALLIVCCLVVYTQLDYMNKLDVGFNREQTLIINTYGDSSVKTRLETFKQEMKQVKGVEKVSASSLVPGDGKSGWSMTFNINGQVLQTEIPVFIVDHDFLDLYEIPVILGRGLDRRYAADSTESMVLNEAAVRSLGFQRNTDIIGATVDMYPAPAKVIGVIRDFNFESLHSRIEPLAMRMVTGQIRKVSVKINSTDIRSTVAAVEAKWKTWVPGKPFEYSFLDDDFNNQYQSESKFGQVFIVFTCLAIVIACLGLYGLSLITTHQKKKEIGIRKIVGASLSQLVILLTKDYLKLVVISFFVGFPVAYYAMTTWLASFSYKVVIGPAVFIAAMVISIGVAIVTVFAQTWRTSVANPVDAIKNE